MRLGGRCTCQGDPWAAASLYAQDLGEGAPWPSVLNPLHLESWGMGVGKGGTFDRIQDMMVPFLLTKPSTPQSLHPRKLTWHWKITIFNRKYIFKWWSFHCHVSLPEGRCFSLVDGGEKKNQGSPSRFWERFKSVRWRGAGDHHLGCRKPCK